MANVEKSAELADGSPSGSPHPEDSKLSELGDLEMTPEEYKHILSKLDWAIIPVRLRIEHSVSRRC